MDSTNSNKDNVPSNSEYSLATPQLQPVEPSTSYDILATPRKHPLLATPNLQPTAMPAPRAATAQKRKTDFPQHRQAPRKFCPSRIGQVACYTCNEIGHMHAQCPKRAKCRWCDMFSHKFEKCPKRLEWVEKSKTMSRLESLKLLDIKDHSGYSVSINIKTVNFIDFVRETYKTHAEEHGGILVRPDTPSNIPDITEIAKSRVYPFTEFLSQVDEGSFTLDQVEGNYMQYNSFRKQSQDSDFDRSPGYDLGGRSPFWPSMLSFLPHLSKSKKPAKYVVNKGHSFFPQDSESEWCLRTLDLTYAKYLIDPSQKLNMPGIDKVELFIGEAQQMILSAAPIIKTYLHQLILLII